MNIERKVKISSSIRKTEQKLPQKKSPQTGTVVRRTKSFYYVDVGDSTINNGNNLFYDFGQQLPATTSTFGNFWKGGTFKVPLIIGE